MNLFRTPGLAKHLKPYYALAEVSHQGNVKNFTAVYQRHETVFERDRTNLLIQRLRNTVIKTGLRKINVAYSRIGLLEISERLGLNSVEDAQWVVAKAIRDGVIEATLD